MDDNEIAQYVKHLAELRREFAEAETACNEMLAAVRETTAYQEYSQAAIRAREYMLITEATIKALTIDHFRAYGDKKPASGVSVKLFTVIEYDPVQALDWARKNLPEALSLDRRLFEQHAKGVAKTQPVPCVVIVQQPRVQIASDLGAEREAANETG